MQTMNWNLWDHQQEFRHEFILNNLELQSLSRQISILRFFSDNIKFLPSIYSPVAFANAMKQNPSKFLCKFSTRQYLYLHDYLVKMITYPRAMATIIGNYFTKEDDNLNFFAHVTFPSIFYNFITDELHKAGASLVNYIILNQPSHLIKAFMLSFIGISTDFLGSIWVNFDIEFKEFKKNHKKDKIEHSDCVVNIFINSLSKSLLHLSISQIELFKSLLNRSKELFGTIVIQNIFIKSYIEYYQDKIKDPKSSAIYQMLNTAGFYPNSLFFNKIAEAIVAPKYTKTRPCHCDCGLINQVPIVLSLHELYIIQQIIFNGYDLKSKQKSENNDPNGSNDQLKLDKAEFSSLGINKPINIQKPGGFTIFSPQVCQNHFEPLYLDLDLTTFYSKSNNDRCTEVSLFSTNMNKKDLDKNNFLSNDEDKTIKFMKDFDLYLTHLSMGKLYISLIREKQLDLFVTLGLYSRQCVDYTKKNHKSGIDWKALFTPQMDRDNLSVSLNLNLKINLPKSFSIGNLNLRHSHSSSFKSEDKEESEKEIQKDLDQLKLKKDVKEKLTKMLKKYGKPNDEISMFVLVRQLDIYESISKEEEEECSDQKEKSENNDHTETAKDDTDDEEEDEEINHKISYLDSNYHETFQNFKESIRKMNQSSERLINKVDENGYFQEFIKKCSNGIDNLANSSHFEMIFGLLYVGLELNEISVHISKNGITDKLHNFNVMKPFINCLFMHSNDKMFDVFVWYHRFINTFPEIKTVIPKKSRIFIDLLVDYFYENFKINDDNSGAE